MDARYTSVTPTYTHTHTHTRHHVYHMRRDHTTRHACQSRLTTIHHTPYTIHHTPYTIHHTPYTIRLAHTPGSPPTHAHSTATARTKEKGEKDTGGRGLAADGSIPDLTSALALGLHRREPELRLPLRKVAQGLPQGVVIHAQSIALPRAFICPRPRPDPTASIASTETVLSTETVHIHIPLHTPAGARGCGRRRGCGRSCSAHTCVCFLCFSACIAGRRGDDDARYA